MNVQARAVESMVHGRLLLFQTSLWCICNPSLSYRVVLTLDVGIASLYRRLCLAMTTLCR